MHLREGSLLQGGKYRIIRFIAAGGYGCTYEAEHTMLKGRVAIKEFFVSDLCNRDSATGKVSVGITSKVALFDKLRRKFVDEAVALFHLSHPGIVHVSDAFEENGTAYFVMDYIDGRSLAEIVKAEGPMSEARALGYIRQVCDALHYVHSNNRLHLDIRPNNIMVTGNDRAILIDFGASKQNDEESGENISSLLDLTTSYAPPEQMSQNIKHFYPATDVYSLGATLYDLLTGEAPPDAAKRTSEEEELQPLPQAISATTRSAVYAALELSKKKRPQSVAAFASLIDVAPMSKPAPAPEPTPTLATTSEPTPAQNPQRQPAPTPTPAPTPEPERATTGSYNGHDWVDLGLSVKWATCNIGASSPSGIIDYYAWGEKNTKSEYTSDNSRTEGKQMGSICGNCTYDVARYKWGSPWRLPSASEIDELLNNCTWEWTTMNGIYGCKVKSKRNSNWIFLPAAGWWGSPANYSGSYGKYWSGTPHESISYCAYSFHFDSLGHRRDYESRWLGISVRPVAE